eukprot:1157341-Pelagomonas_calceolata.AAC.2
MDVAKAMLHLHCNNVSKTLFERRDRSTIKQRYLTRVHLKLLARTRSIPGFGWQKTEVNLKVLRPNSRHRHTHVVGKMP